MNVRTSVALGAILMVAAGCGSGLLVSPPPTGGDSIPPSQEPAPSATPRESDLPTVGPTHSRPPGGVGLAPLSLAIVTVSELDPRVAPSSSADLFEAFLLETPLPKGSRVLILDGPVEADGQRWYMVGITSDVGAPVAWVSSGDSASDTWLQPDAAPCPEVSLLTISALSSLQRFACFGSSPLTFRARQVTAPEDAGFGGVCDPATGQPEWLVCDNVNYNWVRADGNADSGLLLHFDPATGIEPTGLADPGTTGLLWTIRGHFGDRAAPACGTGLEPKSLEYQSAWLDCATLFVVEAVLPAA